MNKEEVISRWKKHKRIIKILKDTDLDKTILEKWKYQIYIYFRNQYLDSKL